MRILIDGLYLTTKHLRGIGRYTQTLCKVIHKYNIGKLYILSSTINSKCITNLLHNLKSVRYKLIILPLPGRFFKALISRLDIYSIIIHVNNIDLVHIPFESFYKTRSKNIMTVHGMEPFINMKKDKFFMDWRNNLLKSVTYVTKYNAVAKSVKLDLIKYLQIEESRVFEIPIGLDDDFFQYNKGKMDRKGLRILYYGGFEKNKNLDNLITAMDQIYVEDPRSISLNIVGDDRWHLDHLDNDLKKPYIKRLGYLDREKLMQEIVLSSCVVIPSIYEGYGLPIIESLSLKTPVLTSKNSGVLNYLSKGFLTFDPNSSEDIYKTIMRYSSNQNEIEQDAAIESAVIKENLNYEKMALGLKNFYTQIQIST